MRKHPKKPPLAIQRLNKVFDRLEVATALELTGGVDEHDLATLLRSQDRLTASTRIDTLARQIGIPYARVVEAYKNMKRLEGVVAIANRLPGVMEGIAEDAEVKEKTCSACSGAGKVGQPPAADVAEDPRPVCIPCEGTGKVRVSGDPIARKQVLEIMELAGGSKSPILAPGSNIVVSNQSLEDMVKAARSTKPQPTTIEVQE